MLVAPKLKLKGQLLYVIKAYVLMFPLMIGLGMSTFTYDPGQLTSGWACRPGYWLNFRRDMHASGCLQQQRNTFLCLDLNESSGTRTLL